ncbi:MAG: signal peptidase I, partial [Actinomycetota bacterium]
RSGPRLMLSVAGWAVAGFAIALAVALLAAQASGRQSLTVMSGSMEPAIRTGDVIVAKPISPIDARVGDVVTYKEPHGESRLITHRVKTMQALQGKVRFTTQGDANDTSEHWQVATTGQIARVTHRVPKLGYALGFLRDPAKRLWLLAIPAVLLGLFELVRIWRPARPEAQGTS